MSLSRFALVIFSFVANAAAVACGPVGSSDGSIDSQDLPPASTFKCKDLDGSQTACVDFNDGKTDGFQSEGGDWKVVDGRYVGWGPDRVPGQCVDSLMTHAIYNTDVVAQDLSVHVQLASIKRVDKVLVLRSIDDANRIELNFRATADDGSFGDLMVQETKACVFTIYTQPGEIKLPHDMGNAIDVDVDLTGTHLNVKVGGNVVLDRDMPVSIQKGKIGVGVIDHSETMFDDLVIRSQDPAP